MPEQELDPAELSRQLQKPTGEAGLQVATKMNEVNHSLYELGWKMLRLEHVEQLLEIGFGNGKHFSNYFEQNPDITVTGVDYSEEMCNAALNFNEQAVSRGQLLIHCADALTMPFGDNSFDLVLGFNTIFFWDPPAPYLAEIRRVLKPEGQLLLGYRPRSSLEKMPFPKQNFTLYEPDDLRTLLSDNGFSVIEEHQSSFEAKLSEENSESVEITDICTISQRS